MTDEEVLTARDQAANEAMEDLGVVVRALEREHPLVCRTRFETLGFVKDALDNFVAQAFFDEAGKAAALSYSPEASQFAEDYAELQRLRQLQNCTTKRCKSPKPMPRYLQKRLGFI